MCSGKRVLKENSVALMKQNAIRDINGSASLGWDVNRPKYMGSMSSEHMIGKTGFTGTCCEVDTQTGYGFVMLSNRTFPVRPKDSDSIDRIRREIADIVFK
jgi:CubicO group peptidase (beta-lactamase class C family)